MELILGMNANTARFDGFDFELNLQGERKILPCRNCPMRILKWTAAVVCAGILTACSSPTNGETGSENGPGSLQGTSSVAEKSSASTESASSASQMALRWVDTKMGFSISQTEITQSDYYSLMGSLPEQMRNSVGDSFPVANVSWYEAILFANALSKKMDLDTAYSYTSRGAGNKLVGLRTDFSKKAVRLPTSDEWKKSYQAGNLDTYYWGTDVASKYAQYILTDGYRPVALKLPNALGLYDMAGNVSEWTADTALQGGSWRSKASELAWNQVEKKTPDFASNETGLRVVLVGE